MTLLIQKQSRAYIVNVRLIFRVNSEVFYMICKYNSKNMSLSENLYKGLLKYSSTIVREIDSNWGNNHFNIRLYEDKGYIYFSVYGLGKVNWSDSVSLEELLVYKDTDIIWKSVYNIIMLVNSCRYFPDGISWKFNCKVLKDLQFYIE